MSRSDDYRISEIIKIKEIIDNFMEEAIESFYNQKENITTKTIINKAIELAASNDPPILMFPESKNTAVKQLLTSKKFLKKIEEIKNKVKVKREEEERQRLVAVKAEEERPEKAATKIQALVRGNKVRAEARRKAAQEKAEEEEEARRKAAQEKAEEEARRKAAQEKAEEEERQRLEELLNKEELPIIDAMNYFDKSTNETNIENIADEFISIEVKQVEGKDEEAEGGKKQAKKPKRKANKTKRAKKSNKKKRKPKRKTLRKIKKIIFR